MLLARASGVFGAVEKDRPQGVHVLANVVLGQVDEIDVALAAGAFELLFGATQVGRRIAELLDEHRVEAGAHDGLADFDRLDLAQLAFQANDQKPPASHHLSPHAPPSYVD